MSDHNSENRKNDHIGLAFESQANAGTNDTRFYYEPLLNPHPLQGQVRTNFLRHELHYPLWISSMTGGTGMAGAINRNLAQACYEFKIGMGLGSCRNLLYSDKYFSDFNLRPIIGPDLPFYANLGIAQVEKMLQSEEIEKAEHLLDKLQANGLIVHVNPLQEYLQPEGDRFTKAPLETIKELLDIVKFPVIVKEVGQGMGPSSLNALLQLPLAAIDFGAYGGTNFSRLELLRTDEANLQVNAPIAFIGHTAAEMINYINDAVTELGEKVKCREVIVSGGIKNFMDGYYNIQAVKLNAVYAQGSAMLQHAQHSYEALRTYIQSQVDGLALCKAYLRIR